MVSGLHLAQFFCQSLWQVPAIILSFSPAHNFVSKAIELRGKRITLDIWYVSWLFLQVWQCSVFPSSPSFPPSLVSLLSSFPRLPPFLLPSSPSFPPSLHTSFTFPSLPLPSPHSFLTHSLSPGTYVKLRDTDTLSVYMTIPIIMPR